VPFFLLPPWEREERCFDKLKPSPLRERVGWGGPTSVAETLACGLLPLIPPLSLLGRRGQDASIPLKHILGYIDIQRILAITPAQAGMMAGLAG
jgi:hypothetical protein